MTHNNKKVTSKSFVLGASMLILGIFLCFSVPRIIQKLRYIELPIESPTSHYRHGDWNNTTYSILTWTYSQNRYYTWRRELSVYPPDFDSWISIAAYFRIRFSREGWVELPESTLCDNWLPESHFLKPGENGYLSYIQKGEDPKLSIPVGCLAIWPTSQDEDGKAESFQIVLLTANPSFLTRLREFFD